MRLDILLAAIFACHLAESKLIALLPLKCKGSFCATPSKTVSAAYLGRQKLEVLESEEVGDKNSAILCDVIPIPLMDSRGESLVNQLQQSSKPVVRFGFDPSSVDGILVNRDNGLYDNLPYIWRKGSNAKLELFNLLQKGKSLSSEGSFLTAVDRILGSTITAILIEVKDQLSKDKIVLGGAVVLSQNNVAADWKITPSNPLLPDVCSTDDPNDVAQCTACIVPCHMDELVAMSLLTRIPILIPKSLFEALAIDATLTSSEDIRGKSEIFVTGPTFFSAEDAEKWKDGFNNASEDPAVKQASPAWEIFDAKKFLKMSSIEKRAILRASGVTALPRPREGLDSLDRALMDKMDDAVRGEVLRLRSKGSAPPVESSRQAVLQAMGEALDEGDMERATELREDFMAMTARRADPTQPEGSYDPYLDQDDWYMAARRKAMAPKK